MCIFHKWEYIGYVQITRWFGGLFGGIPYEIAVEAEQCIKCEKVKTLE